MEKKVGEVENKIPDFSSLVTTAIINLKVGEVEKKIPDTSGLATAPVLNTKIGEVENKIPYVVSSLVKKTVYNAKIRHREKINTLLFLTTINLQVN